MRNKIISLTKKLISFKTVETNYSERVACLEHIQKYLAVNKSLLIKKFKTKTGSALLITNNKGSPKLCFNGHVDVVPASPDDFKAQVKKGKILGRGAIDMKSAVAVLVEVFRNLRTEALSVGLLLVDDEEQRTGCSTATIIKRARLRPKFSIVAEQTDFSLVVKQKGTMNIVVTSLGRSAHGAEPQRGINAITNLFSALQKINSSLIFAQRGNFCPTCVVSTISGGEAVNSVPAQARATINIRYTSFFEAEKIKILLEQVESEDILIEIEIKPCLEVDTKNSLLKQLKMIAEKETGKKLSLSAYPTGSDAKYFAAVGLPVVVFGPVGGNYHTKNEWVEVGSLEKYYRIINKFIYSSKINN